ncbi:MAG: DUF3313 domain-containing protein [Candidatus Omnitrophota bacterium]|jgi:hypothetical protein
MIQHRFLRIMLLGLPLLPMTGCSTPPAPDAGFIDGTQTAQRADFPFQRAWAKEGVDWKQFTGIYIAPVDISHALKSGSWKAVERYGKAQGDLQKEADYMQRAFVRAFLEDPNKRFKVVDTPSQGDLVLEMALVELVPNSPSLKAASYAPVVGIAFTVINAADSDSVAFEARIVDGGTGEIIVTAADRRKAKMSLVNVQDFTWYGHADTIIKDWAKEFVKITNRQPGEIVKKSSGFQLKPW